MKSKALRIVSISVVACLFARFAAAQLFGIPSIVFDPSSYATLGQIWASNLTTVQKLILEYNQLVRIYTNGTQMYQLSQMMAQRFSHPSRMGWMTTAQMAVNNVTLNQYGETVAWPMMINGRPEFVGAAWGAATIPVTGMPFLTAHNGLGASLLSRLSGVELIDGSAQQCLGAIAQYRQNAQMNGPAFARLQGVVMDDTDATNSNIQQLNQVNAGQMQMGNEQRAQGAIQACIAQQEIVASKLQRDEIAQGLNYSAETQQALSDPSANWSGDTAFATYRIP